jgi:DNA replication protein DnaC
LLSPSHGHRADTGHWEWTPGNPGAIQIPKELIRDIATLRFIPERGALILGPAGLGKSHLCISRGVCAVEAGYAVFCRSAFDLAEVPPPQPARRFVRRLAAVDLLLLEDLSGRFPPTTGEDLLEIFSRRYETGASIVSSNRPTLVTAAALLVLRSTLQSRTRL